MSSLPGAALVQRAHDDDEEGREGEGDARECDGVLDGRAALGAGLNLRRERHSTPVADLEQLTPLISFWYL